MAINTIHDNIVGIKGTIKRYAMKDRLNVVQTKSQEELRVDPRLQQQQRYQNETPVMQMAKGKRMISPIPHKPSQSNEFKTLSTPMSPAQERQLPKKIRVEVQLSPSFRGTFFQEEDGALNKQSIIPQHHYTKHSQKSNISYKKMSVLDSPKVELYDESNSQSENVSDSQQYFPQRHKLPDK